MQQASGGQKLSYGRCVAQLLFISENIWVIEANRDIKCIIRQSHGQTTIEAMRDSQLQKMSLKELNALHAKIEVAIAEKRASERRQVRSKMEELARASGFSVGELFAGRAGKGSKIAPKYRNPKDPSQTWTGRGRRPKWMVEAGGDMKRFLITS